jgi:hypothetical protein
MKYLASEQPWVCELEVVQCEACRPTIQRVWRVHLRDGLEQSIQHDLELVLASALEVELNH